MFIFLLDKYASAASVLEKKKGWTWHAWGIHVIYDSLITVGLKILQHDKSRASVILFYLNLIYTK